MLKQILDDTKLEPAFCASLIGVSSEQLGEWVSGRESLPRFVIPELSSILGIPADELSAAANKSPGERGSMSTIWYKLRDEKLTEADREMVGIVRKLGFYYHQLQELAEGEVIGHKRLLSAVRRKVDSSAPAEVQGGAAAQAVRNAAGFNQGQGGIGELIRPYLRRMGLLVVESPLRGSLVEGCSFVVASAGVDTPCIFTNSYKAGWFRRNVVVMHELGHIIFDVEDDQVRLDYQGGGSSEFSETRAQVFARECLVPKSVLIHFTNQLGLKWDALTERQIAELMAKVHVEAKLILDAAFEAGFVDRGLLTKYRAMRCEEHLREFSSHALPTREYLKTLADESPRWIAENRNTRIATRSFRLPSGYLGRVVEACNCGDISVGKAAEMLMMDRKVFKTRYKDILTVFE